MTIHKTKTSIMKFPSTFLLFILSILSSCNNTSQKPSAAPGPTFTSYWDGFNFADTLLIDNPGITAPKFAEFCKLLSSMPDGDRNRQIDTLLHRSLVGGGINMYQSIMDLAEKYLADPNSPYRDEEAYIRFLEHTVSEPHITADYKERPRFQLRLAMKNRVGTLASNFEYVTRSGAAGTLYGIKAPYTLIYFNNPDCHDCKRVSNYIQHSAIIQRLISSKSLALLAIYPDRQLRSWNAHKDEYPSAWTVARYASDKSREAYNLPAIPSLYLLDNRKTVIYKDAPIETIEAYMESHCKSDMKKMPYSTHITSKIQ